MPDRLPTRLRATLLGLAAFTLAASANAQLTPTGQPKPSAGVPASLPPTSPTELPAPKPAAPLLPGQQPARRAKVAWAGGLLTIQAENSSLNQILRAVATQTGMKITGGVTDERVYGTYGPASPSKVLEALLNGSGSNLLLVLADASTSGELILTPRHGGVTPPNPNAGAADDRDPDEDRPPQQQRPGPATGYRPPMRLSPPTPPVSEPPATIAPPSTSTPDASTPATTSEQSPNGVKTPQQIYEQLLQMQQKKTQTPQ